MPFFIFIIYFSTMATTPIPPAVQIEMSPLPPTIQSTNVSYKLVS